jgi:hypothetical protein
LPKVFPNESVKPIEKVETKDRDVAENQGRSK